LSAESVPDDRVPVEGGRIPADGLGFDLCQIPSRGCHEGSQCDLSERDPRHSPNGRLRRRRHPLSPRDRTPPPRAGAAAGIVLANEITTLNKGSAIAAWRTARCPNGSWGIK